MKIRNNRTPTPMQTNATKKRRQRQGQGLVVSKYTIDSKPQERHARTAHQAGSGNKTRIFETRNVFSAAADRFRKKKIIGAGLSKIARLLDDACTVQ